MQVQISSDDYLAAIRAGFKPRPVFAVLGGLIVLLALLALGGLLYFWQRTEHGWTDVLGLAPAVAVLLAPALLRSWIQRTNQIGRPKSSFRGSSLPTTLQSCQ